MARVELKPLPPEEAIDYFSHKGFRPSFAWQEVWQGEHAKAFTVAKMLREDLLADTYEAVTRALAEGRTLKQFRDELEPILAAKGWWGRQRMTDPATGESRIVQLGNARRLEIIYDVNLRTARAAGLWARTQRSKALLPYLRYVAVLDERTRDDHRRWSGTVLPVDHAWWQTHYPPNGWRCRCTVVQLTAGDLKRQGLTVSEPPPVKTRPWRNPRTGEVVEVPQGIDPGFGYNVGEAYLSPLVPPPLTAPPTVGVPGRVPPALPAPRPARAAPLPASVDPAEAARAFLQAFGARPGKPAVFEDAIGSRLVVDERLFTRPGGATKLTKDERSRYLPLLAHTIKDPDEIWAVWSQVSPGSRVVLRRRYLARWQLPGEEVAGFAVFEVGKEGWTGVTIFPPKQGKAAASQLTYLEGMRRGALLYRRKE